MRHHLLHYTLYIIHSTLALAALCAASASRADIALAPYFRDNAVLQRDKPLPIWGRADPGENVTITFLSQTATATADDMGRWRVTLRPIPANATPTKLTAKGKNTITLRNILVGDVWLCSGQSNMAWTIASARNPSDPTDDTDHPLIRHYKTPLTSAATPCDDVGGEWQECTPATADDFSAVALNFGRELYKTLNIPIGLLNSSWGGTQIESWMSPTALAADPHWPAIRKRWQAWLSAHPAKEAQYQAALDARSRALTAAKTLAQSTQPAPPIPPIPVRPEGPASRREPSALYNSMIVPFLPAAIRGIIWYQGEANAPRYAEYRTLFPEMIRQWRADFQQGDIPFLYVQLAAYDRGADWPWQRDAQQAALKLPATAQALAIDNPDNDILHPKNKQTVAHRLFLAALALSYDRPVEHTGPVYSTVTREGASLRVTFTHAAGLKTKDPLLPGFQIAGLDKKFHPATARIENETILVSSPNVPDPLSVRYAWSPAPPITLYNAADLPASPFRTDDWEK